MVAENAREEIEKLNAKLGPNYRLMMVDPRTLKLSKKNARFMKPETFRALVANVKRDGALSSVPLCTEKADGLHVLSGNHRTQAAIKADLPEIVVMVCAATNRSQEIAVQLSHNSLVGQDEPIVLKELWEEIEDMASKSYAGLDDELLESLGKANVSSLSPVNLDFRVITFAFLPHEVERLNEVMAAAIKEAKGADGIYLCRFDDFDRLLDAMESVKKDDNVKNAAVAMGVILDRFVSTLNGKAEAEEKDKSGR